MKMKRVFCIILAVFVLCALAACGKSPGSGEKDPGLSSLSGGPAEILEKIVEDTKVAVEAAGGFMYMSMTSDVTAEISQNTVGLSEADFEQYVLAASSSMAAIGSQAHQIILIQTKDAGSAVEVKKLVAGRVSGKNGYDPQKWICVWPEQAIAVESGNYVLIAASRKDVVEATLLAFAAEAINYGEVDVFYEHIEE